MRKNLLLFAVLTPLFCIGQTNMLITSSTTEQVIIGNYDPAPYAGTQVLDPVDLASQLEDAISPDSLKASLIKLATFRTRNSGSDTVSTTEGYGAARRWAFQKFKEISQANNNRLLPSYFQFDQSICGMGQHSNVLGVLPGSVPSSGFILVEGHMDSRCASVCDVDCVAEGIEDNGSGTALVLELARVMAQYEFPNTIVFMITTAEEQGLYGAQAFAIYAQQNNLPLRAVLNNDVIGGIICGKTSSAPSCPGLNDIDSIGVRLFSQGGYNSKNKQLARFIKLEYQENLLPYVAVPMDIRIMSPEDRSGRGGDHIPFRQRSFAAMRFTSANEHGNASNNTGYTDRQHTSDDVLGVDTDGDMVVDSFFVDFNYLARNTLINANAASIAARNVPLPPDFTAIRSNDKLIMNFNTAIDTQTIRIALRSVTNDWDTVYTLSPSFSDELFCNPSLPLYVSVAGVDNYGAESLFSSEKIVSTSATKDPETAEDKGIELYQNHPNPFDEATWISFFVHKMPDAVSNSFVQISDHLGKTIQQIPVQIKPGMNEVLYSHGYGVTGAFVYTLIVNGRKIESKQMIFAN